MEKVEMDSKELIEKLSPSRRVLEVGFGLMTEQILQKGPSHYTIIESDPDKIKEAKEFAKKHPNVSVKEGDWREVLPTLGEFESIFFYEPLAEKKSSYEKSAKLVEEGQKVLSYAEEEVPEIKTIKYSDEDLEMFCDQVVKLEPKELSVFLSELLKNEQITEEQHNRLLQKYDLAEEKIASKAPPVKVVDSIYPFVSQCLKNHLVKDGRLVVLSTNTKSKFEDSHFFEEIITNVNYNYQERKVSNQKSHFLELFIEKCE